MRVSDYVTRVLDAPGEIAAADWNELLSLQAEPSPFMRHEYLAAMSESGSATPDTGWTPRFVTLWQADVLQAACALYLKDHSYGEYVFDWSWANAYQQHRVPYYPKGLIAAPFTPVPGTRLLARNAAARAALIGAVIALCENEGLSSVHMLFAGDADVAAASEAGLMLRHTVQFHWRNVAPRRPTDLDPDAARGAPRFKDFDDFLASLNQEKRKKIRQERRKVAEAGVTFRWARGADIDTEDWDFFYRCYERTYLEHGNAPYLSRDFFQRMADTMPGSWLLFVAERAGRPIASSLIAIGEGKSWAKLGFDSKNPGVAYGRYWGALERVDCLHFEACYYQPLAWCIEHGFDRFEGGAQGEHKMARALLPVKTTSAHWLAHPAFADAVERFLEREVQGISEYMEALAQRNPFKPADAAGLPPG